MRSTSVAHPRPSILRQPEIQDFDESVMPDHEILGLDVAMDDASRVRRR
jgi:hypothetical protein